MWTRPSLVAGNSSNTQVFPVCGSDLLLPPSQPSRNDVGEGRSKGALEYNGMVNAFRKTVRQEGFGALYKGLVPNSVKVVPSIAIAFVTYEMVKNVLGVKFRISD